MRSLFKGLSLGVWCSLLSHAAYAEIVKVRLTSFLPGASVQQVLGQANTRAGTTLRPTDFAQVERISLATSDFEMYVQMRAGRPILESRLRLWKTKTGQIFLAEAHLDKPSNNLLMPPAQKSAREEKEMLLDQEGELNRLVRQHHDNVVPAWSHEDGWRDDAYVRVFQGEGSRGEHEFVWSHNEGKFIAHSYQEHHQGELAPVEAMGYKVYEQSWYTPEDVMQPEVLTLKYLNDKAVAQEQDPFAPLTRAPFLRSRFDEQRGSTEEGVRQGYWSNALLRALLTQSERAIVPVDNGFNGPEGLILDGRYVSVSIHPKAKSAAGSANIPWRYTNSLQSESVRVMNDMGMQFVTGYVGKTYSAASELMQAPVRHPQHDVKTYIEDGADQVQVYWAVTEMMEQLHALGFTDPEISTRKFEAIMYNPDPFYRNNAFYNADTINFTTYSPEASNFARDNTTIWHEIGHGIIDRLAGQITLVKGEGFHEGIADFLAELVLQSSSFGREFPGRTSQRIYNVAAFNFANEAHDDGEAFGGFMKDVLEAAIHRWGRDGLKKTADLTLEAMRFTRGHPALDEQEWVEKLLYTDTRASSKRAAGEFRPLIEQALAERNFSANGAGLASMQVKVNNQALRRGGTGGRNNPMSLPKDRETRFNLKVNVNDGTNFKFTYPITIKVAAGNGAKGPIDWLDEDAGVKTATLTAPGQEASIDMGVSGRCDVLNLGTSCRESLFVDIHNAGEDKPRARQRLYVQLGSLFSF